MRQTVPLLQLIKKGTTLKWDEEKQRIFDRIKQLFCESAILYFPAPKKEYYLETDASNYALGAVLYKKNDKQEKEVITLASRTLKGPELSYFTTEKELLAIVWALQKFRTITSPWNTVPDGRTSQQTYLADNTLTNNGRKKEI